MSWLHNCYHKRQFTVMDGHSCALCGATAPAPECQHCVLLNHKLDNATAEIERLRALVRPNDRVAVRLG